MSFAKDKSITAFQMKQAHLQLPNLFHLPLSETAYEQFQELQVTLDNLDVAQEKDTWTYIWGQPNFKVSKAYKHLMGHVPVHPIYHSLWGSACQLKQKIFSG